MVTSVVMMSTCSMVTSVVMMSTCLTASSMWLCCSHASSSKYSIAVTTAVNADLSVYRGFA